jgi:sporulation protein YlmC with PRC-barrel domain
MDLPLNVDVHCSDGRCGRSTYIILNPALEQVTHLVVKERRPSTIERLVPVNWVVNTTPEVILLDHTRAEFAQLDSFNQTDFIFANVPHHAMDPKLTLLWPYVVPAQRVVDETYQRLAPGELAVHRGTRVRATDGRVGNVDEFVVDADSGYITHLVLREGHLWGQKEVFIPVSQIDRIEDDRVYLKVDKKSIEALPAIPVRRRW